MVKKTKLLEALRRNPRNVPLRKFEALLRDYGQIEEGGKHPLAVIGKQTLPYKRENPVKACYVKEALDIIAEEFK